MPQNFGLIIGTKQDAEKRLKESISIDSYFITKESDSTYENGSEYIFYNPNETKLGEKLKNCQRGAIRCVSKNLTLTKLHPSKTKFLVEEKILGGGFEFYPIKPTEELTKGERYF